MIGVLLGILALATTALADPLPRNWPMPPAELERRFEREPFAITSVEGAESGTSGAVRLTLRFADGKVVEAKWKPVSDASLDDWNNSPRRELASYRIQRFFLDERDYVVPTSAFRCIPIEDYGLIRKDAAPTLESSRCVLGLLSVWLQHVSSRDPFYDPARFARDEAYARHFGDFNLLTFLIDHRDGKLANLLVSTDASDPRAFSVDNGISFESFPWNMEATNWNDLRVPWVRKDRIDRLRGADEAKIRALGVVAEMTRDESGIFRPSPPTENMGEGKGVRKEGARIQLGLTDLEIHRVRRRIERLLREVDEGRLQVR